MEKLTQASHLLAETMYRTQQEGSDQAQPDQQTSSETAEEKENEEVIDAEYVDVDDKK